MPSAGAARSSLLQTTRAVKGRCNSSSQRGDRRDSIFLPACTPARKHSSFLWRELQWCGAGKPPLSARVQGGGWGLGLGVSSGVLGVSRAVSRVGLGVSQGGPGGYPRLDCGWPKGSPGGVPRVSRGVSKVGLGATREGPGRCLRWV